VALSWQPCNHTSCIGAVALTLAATAVATTAAELATSKREEKTGQKYNSNAVVLEVIDAK